MIKKKKQTDTEPDQTVENFQLKDYDQHTEQPDETDLRDLLPLVNEPDLFPKETDEQPDPWEQLTSNLEWVIENDSHTIRIEALNPNGDTIEIPTRYRIKISDTNTDTPEAAITTIATREDALNNHLTTLVIERIRTMAEKINK